MATLTVRLSGVDSPRRRRATRVLGVCSWAKVPRIDTRRANATVGEQVVVEFEPVRYWPDPLLVREDVSATQRAVLPTNSELAVPRRELGSTPFPTQRAEFDDNLLPNALLEGLNSWSSRHTSIICHWRKGR